MDFILCLEKIILKRNSGFISLLRGSMALSVPGERAVGSPRFWETPKNQLRLTRKRASILFPSRECSLGANSGVCKPSITKIVKPS